MSSLGTAGCAMALLLGFGVRPDALVGQSADTVDPVCARVLPVAAAVRLTGQADLELIPRHPSTGAGGTCNYAAGGKKMALLVTILNEKSHAPEAYSRYKGQAEYQKNQHELAGLGDAAFTGGTYEHEVVARKGSQIIMVASMVRMDRASHTVRAVVSKDQLVAVAREIVARL